MVTSSFEGIVENGQIRLLGDVLLPEHARVFVVMADRESPTSVRLMSPRLANPLQASDFVKEVVEAVDDAL